MYVNNDEYVLSLERKLERVQQRELERKERIKKIILTTTATIALLAIPTASIAHTYSQLSNWESTREVITVQVQPGEGIDHYWAEYAPSWMDREIYREEIKELNNMSNSSLRSGQTLKIYIEGGN
jgi:hypothetical protein